MNSLKVHQEQLSTLELQETKSYSSRFQRSRGRQKNQIADSLPYRRERAAITIQRFWRRRMALRRIFYEQMLQQLTYENSVERAMIQNQQHYLNGLKRENFTLDKKISEQVEMNTKGTQQYVKSVARECVAMTFKFQKRMIAEKELDNFLREKENIRQSVEELKKYRQGLKQCLHNNGRAEEQVLLRELREANGQLLQIVNQRNQLKHELRERMLETSRDSSLESFL